MVLVFAARPAIFFEQKDHVGEDCGIGNKIIMTHRGLGGFEANGTINHEQIPSSKNSIEFNFDGSATSDLVSGEIYQWKIYADKDNAANVDHLISSSEDLMGLFQIP